MGAKKLYKKVSSADEVAENPLANDELLLSVDDSVKDSQHATWGLKKAAKDAWQTSSKAAKKAAKDAKKLYKKVSSADEVAENPLANDELLLSVDDSVKDSQHATWGLKKA